MTSRTRALLAVALAPALIPALARAYQVPCTAFPPSVEFSSTPQTSVIVNDFHVDLVDPQGVRGLSAADVITGVNQVNIAGPGSTVLDSGDWTLLCERADSTLVAYSARLDDTADYPGAAANAWALHDDVILVMERPSGDANTWVAHGYSAQTNAWRSIATNVPAASAFTIVDGQNQRSSATVSQGELAVIHRFVIGIADDPMPPQTRNETDPTVAYGRQLLAFSARTGEWSKLELGGLIGEQLPTPNSLDAVGNTLVARIEGDDGSGPAARRVGFSGVSGEFAVSPPLQVQPDVFLIQHNVALAYERPFFQQSTWMARPCAYSAYDDLWHSAQVADSLPAGPSSTPGFYQIQAGDNVFVVSRGGSVNRTEAVGARSSGWHTLAVPVFASTAVVWSAADYVVAQVDQLAQRRFFAFSGLTGGGWVEALGFGPATNNDPNAIVLPGAHIGAVWSNTPPAPATPTAWVFRPIYDRWDTGPAGNGIAADHVAVTDGVALVTRFAVATAGGTFDEVRAWSARWDNMGQPPQTIEPSLLRVTGITGSGPMGDPNGGTFNTAITGAFCVSSEGLTFFDDRASLWQATIPGGIDFAFFGRNLAYFSTTGTGVQLWSEQRGDLTPLTTTSNNLYGIGENIAAIDGLSGGTPRITTYSSINDSHAMHAYPSGTEYHRAEGGDDVTVLHRFAVNAEAGDVDFGFQDGLAGNSPDTPLVSVAIPPFGVLWLDTAYPIVGLPAVPAGGLFHGTARWPNVAMPSIAQQLAGGGTSFLLLYVQGRRAVSSPSACFLLSQRRSDPVFFF